MKYLDLLEQIELVEAAKDKYAPMFNFMEQLPKYPGTSFGQTAVSARRLIEEYLNWATTSLSNSDRIIWALRQVKMTVFNMLISAVGDHIQNLRGWGKLTPDAQKEMAEFEALEKKLYKLLQRDLTKAQQNARTDVEKDRQEADARYQHIKGRLEEKEALCQQQPDHADCNFTLRDWRNKAEEAQQLVSVLDEEPSVMAMPYEELNSMRANLDHFESINYQPMRDYRFGWKPLNTVTSVLSMLEQNWQKKMARTLVHDTGPGEDYEGIEKVIEFPDKFAWWNLHRSYCSREGAAMGHCGNNYANMKDSDEIISLRSHEGQNEQGQELWKTHVTAVWDSANGMLGEMKTVGNNKPPPEYHPYIIEMLKQPWLKGILMRPHQHEKYKNFYVSDLPEETARALIDEKPDLATWKDRRELGIEGDMSEMELDKVNEQLDEWNIDSIQEQRDNVFVLTSYSNNKQMYEYLSGGGWPDEGDIDYPEESKRHDIYSYLDNSVKQLFSDFVFYTDRQVVSEYLEIAEQELEPDDLDFETALEIVKEEGWDDPLEEITDEAYKSYHASGMESEAEYALDNMHEYSSSPYEFSLDQEGEEGTAITMDVEYFFSEVMPNLEEAASKSYGKMSWEQLLELRVYDASESYWESQYGDSDSDAYMAEQIETKAVEVLEKEIQKLKTSADFEAEELRRKQTSLGLDEPEQPEDALYKGRIDNQPRKGARTFTGEQPPMVLHRGSNYQAFSDKAEEGDYWRDPKTGEYFIADLNTTTYPHTNWRQLPHPQEEANPTIWKWPEDGPTVGQPGPEMRAYMMVMSRLGKPGDIILVPGELSRSGEEEFYKAYHKSTPDDEEGRLGWNIIQSHKDRPTKRELSVLRQKIMPKPSPEDQEEQTE